MEVFLVSVGSAIVGALVTYAYELVKVNRGMEADDVKSLVAKKCKADLFTAYDPWIPNLPIEKRIDSELRRVTQPGKQRGMSVILAPQDIGKTTRVKKILDKYRRERKISGVVFLDASTIDSFKTPHAVFLSTFFGKQVKEDVIDFWSALPDSSEDSPLVIVVDQIERMPTEGEEKKEFQHFFRSIAVKCVNEKRFAALALTADPAVAELIIGSNGGSKIFAAKDMTRAKAGMTYENCEAVLDAYVKANLVRERLSTEDKEWFLRQCEKAATIGTMQRLIEDEYIKNQDQVQRKCTNVAEKWTLCEEKNLI